MTSRAWLDDFYYEPAADMVGPVVTAPGPDCAHPLRLCMVTSRDVCPHALSEVMGRTGYHVTRCLRDAEPMTHAEIGVVLGVCRERVGDIEASGISKLRANPLMMEVRHDGPA